MNIFMLIDLCFYNYKSYVGIRGRVAIHRLHNLHCGLVYLLLRTDL